MRPNGDETRASPVLSLPSRMVIAAAVSVVAVAVAIHLAMMFLHVSPSNTLSKRYGAAIDDYALPEYEQNWKLFAPNPLQQNTAVQARAELRVHDGGAATTTGWVDLTARDGAAVHHNPLPSHTQQNELRRAWELFLDSHDARNRPDGRRGELSERYIRRIVLGRLHAEWTARGRIDRVQVRSVTTPVGPPPWNGERVSYQPAYRVVPWWSVSAADIPGSAGSAGSAGPAEGVGRR